MGRYVGRDVLVARGRARKGLGIAAFVAVGAVALSACFPPAPKPAPPAPPASSTTSSTTSTTTTTTTTAPSAHLVGSPAPMNFSVERTQFPALDTQTVTITNSGSVPSGVLGLPDLSGLTEPGTPGSNWSVGNDTCFNASLPAGGSCQFDLTLGVSAHKNPAPWTGDLTVSATPGGTAHVSVTAQYTSKVEYDNPPATLNTTVASPSASDDFVVKNASSGDLTVSSFSLSTIGGMPPTGGTFAPLGNDAGSPVQACSLNLVLHAGDSCQWQVTYTNGTGVGTNNAQLQFTVGGFPNSVLFAAAGNP